MEHRLSATLELKDKFTSQIKSASANLMKFKMGATKTGNAIKDTANCISDSAKSISGSIKAFLGFNAGGIAFNFMKGTFQDYAELDQVLTKNKAIMGASAEESKILKAQVLELGKTMPFTAKEVAEAQKYQAMAGLKTNDILALTPKLLKLSVASGEDLARTSDIMTDNLDAFGLKLSDADRLMDVMAATANNTNTSIGMLGEAYQYVAATSRSFDSFEEVNILLGVLANNGIKGAKAGRNLAAVYTRLANATPDMEKALQKVGLKLYDNNGKFKGLRRILEEVKPKLAKMTEEQRNYWLTTIAGAEGMKVFASILGYSKEGMDKVEKSVMNSKGAVEEINEEMKNTPQNKIKELESAWDNLKLTIAEGATPAILESMKSLTDTLNNTKLEPSGLENYFKKVKKLISEGIQAWAAYKLAVMASKIHPTLGAVVSGAFIGNKLGLYAGNKIGKFFAKGNNISEDRAKYINQGHDPRLTWALAKRDQMYRDKFQGMDTVQIDNYLKKEREEYEKTTATMDLNKKKKLDKVLGYGNNQILENNLKPVKNDYIYRPTIVPPIKKLNSYDDTMTKLNEKLNYAPITNNIEPKINVNLGRVTINNEMDKDKIKQLVSSELDNQFKQLDTYNQTTR